MKRPLVQALEAAQMMIPEVDLNLTFQNGEIRMFPPPLAQWHYYLNAMDSAVDLIMEETDHLPDVDPINEIRAITEDVSSLICALKTFYLFTLDELDKINKANPTQPQIPGPGRENIERYSKYRRIIDRKNYGIEESKDE